MNIKKSIKTQVKRICATALSFVMMGQPIVGLAEDYRQAGVFSKDGGIYTHASNSYVYSLHDEGGFTVYIPYDQSWSGYKIYKSMFDGLFNIYKSGHGSNYDDAGGTYENGVGWITASGKKIYAPYFVKKLSTDESGESIYATTDLMEYEPEHNVEFRYSGIIISAADSSGVVVTNPTFTADTTWKYAATGKTEKSYEIYKKGFYPEVHSNITMYKDAVTTEVLERDNLVKDYPGSYGVPTNIASSSPYYGKAEGTFNKWADTTEIGARYRAKYAGYVANPEDWWKELKDYVRIDGDYETQSVLLTFVHKNSSGTFYRTHSIPFPVESNMIASKIQVLDEKQNVLDYSMRDPGDIKDAYSGADYLRRNVLSGGTVALERGKTYTIELAMTYMSAENTQSVTEKDTEAARPDIQILSRPADGINSRLKDQGLFSEHTSELTTQMTQMSAAEKDRNDPTLTGPINTEATGRLATKDGNLTFNFGQTTHKVVSVTVDETFPTYGTLKFTVPTIYDSNGDNKYQTDDYIDLYFTVSEIPIPPPEYENPNSYGDMNLGRKEYRRLHYWKEVEKPNPEKPIKVVNPETGLEEETGEFEMMIVECEYVTDYGWWDDYSSAPEGEEVGEWEGKPESSGNIYHVNGEQAWWEYDQRWPNQGEDAVYKIWLKNAGQSWSENGETYKRSETEDNPFTLGFSTSRSRGEENDMITPTIKVEIYGISPDTDDDGELIETKKITGNPIKTYAYSENNYMYLENQLIAERVGNYDYPFIRVYAEIDESHGESGIYGDPTKSPYNNGWQDEHDTYERTFAAKSDDIELTDIKIKDSEGVVIYHAEQSGGDWDVIVQGYFDKDEDYSMDVEMTQTESAGHNVKDPSIDVRIIGQDKNGNDISTYVDRTITLKDEEIGLDDTVIFKDIAFRAKDVFGIEIEVEINDRHGSGSWRENKWDDDEDTFTDRIQCTTANLKVSPNIELVNSKYNIQNYLTFAEKLNFKFDIQHIGEGERQMAIVGNSSASPLARLDIEIYDADKLTKDAYGNLVYDNVKLEDPKATGALIWSGTSTAETKLYPGLGSMNYASHVQSWIHDYVVQSHSTLSGNIAAYGHILVTAQISDIMHTKGLNVNNSPSEDYVQQEFAGEHNIAIVDMAVTGQNSISDNSWYYGNLNKNPASGEQVIPNRNGISVSVAIQNQPSSFGDSTVVDRTYLDIFIGNDDVPVKSVIVDLPQGDVVPVEVVIPDVLIERDMVVTAKVNYGFHQTHYEYVLPKTDPVLNQDPFTDNLATRTVSPNLPDTESAPGAEIYEHIPNAAL